MSDRRVVLVAFAVEGGGEILRARLPAWAAECRVEVKHISDGVPEAEYDRRRGIPAAGAAEGEDVTAEGVLCCPECGSFDLSDAGSGRATCNTCGQTGEARRVVVGGPPDGEDDAQPMAASPMLAALVAEMSSLELPVHVAVMAAREQAAGDSGEEVSAP